MPVQASFHGPGEEKKEKELEEQILHVCIYSEPERKIWGQDFSLDSRRSAAEMFHPAGW